jgi:hypothetical protein
MFSQFYNFTIIYTTRKNKVLANALSSIYEKWTTNTEAEIMKYPTIKESFSALTI